MGDLKQGDQPLGSEPGSGVTVVIASVATSLALVSFSQDAAQAHSHPGVQFRAHASCPSLEVAAPAPYHPIYIDDDLLQGSPVTALGSLSDSFFELLLTLLTRPFARRFRQSDGRGRPSHIVARASPPAERPRSGQGGSTIVDPPTGAEAEAPAYYQGVPPDFAEASSGRPGRYV